MATDQQQKDQKQSQGQQNKIILGEYKIKKSLYMWGVQISPKVSQRFNKANFYFFYQILYVLFLSSPLSFLVLQT